MAANEILDLFWREESSAGDHTIRRYTANHSGRSCALTVTDDADGAVVWESSTEPARPAVAAPSLKMIGRAPNGAVAREMAKAYAEGVTPRVF